MALALGHAGGPMLAVRPKEAALSRRNYRLQASA